MKNIKILGARTHNLHNITLTIPRDKLIVIKGLSGSGKSSLTFDILYSEGQRCYVESLSSYAHQFFSLMEKPNVEYMKGYRPRFLSNKNQLYIILILLWVQLLQFIIICVCYSLEWMNLVATNTIYLLKLKP